MVRHDNPHRLTARQRLFARELLVDFNPCQAYRRAGYKARTDNAAYAGASRLLRCAKDQAELRDLMQARAEAVKIKAEKVLREIARVAFSDIGSILDFSGDQPRLRPARDMPVAARRAIASMKVKRYLEGRGEEAREVEVVETKLWDKAQALRDLAQQLGLLQEGTGTQTAVAVTNPVDLAAIVGEKPGLAYYPAVIDAGNRAGPCDGVPGGGVEAATQPGPRGGASRAARSAAPATGHIIAAHARFGP
jgi:phage terminase small subunit